MATEKRSVRDIIDDAIDENRVQGWLVHSCALGFVLCGVLVVLRMAFGDPAILESLAGAVVSSIAVPSIYISAAIRRENIKLRLLEAALDRSTSAKDALAAIREIFDIEQPVGRPLSVPQTQP